MMSLGPRPNIPGKTERKPGGFDSLLRTFSTSNSKTNTVDQTNQALLFLQTSNGGDSPPVKRTDNVKSTSGTMDHMMTPAKAPDQEVKTSPLKLPQPFRRNPSMTSRTKKIHRLSMPAFKFNSDSSNQEVTVSKPSRRSGFITYIDTDFIEKASTSVSSTPVGTPTSTVNGFSQVKNYVPPRIPSRTRKAPHASQLPSSTQAFSASKMETNQDEFVSSLSVRRIASFPASQAPVCKDKYEASPVSFRPSLSKPPVLTPLSLDGVSEASSDSVSPTWDTSTNRSSRKSLADKFSFQTSSHASQASSEPFSPQEDPMSPQSDPFTSPRNSFTDFNPSRFNSSQSGPSSPVTGAPVYQTRQSSVNQRGKGLSRHRSAVVRRKVSFFVEIFEHK